MAFIGVIGFGIFTQHEMACEIDLALIIHEKFRHEKYGTEAFTLAIHYSFEQLYAKVVTAGAYEHNLTMQHIIEKLGFARNPMDDVLIESVFTRKPIRQLAYTLSNMNTDHDGTRDCQE